MMMDQKSLAESPKSVLTHERVTRTLDAGGDAPQLTSKEVRPAARHARQPADAFEDPKPHTPGGTPSGSAAAMGCPRSIRSPLEPLYSQLSNTKNDEERERKKTMERQNVDEKVV